MFRTSNNNNKKKNVAANEIPYIMSTNENKKKNTAVLQNNNIQIIFGLLQTVYVNAIDWMGQKRNIRMLCDNGSNQHYSFNFALMYWD